jgi:putative intracellular protease/amidase/YHS domain-containing protein
MDESNEGAKMKRRDLLKSAAAFGVMAAIPFSASELAPATPKSPGPQDEDKPEPLKAPAHGSIPVAFLISDGAVVIDFCGPWEVFQDVSVPGGTEDAFRLYTVSETIKPVRASAGLKIVPDYTIDNAPPPKVIVIPAQSKPSKAVIEWIRKSAKSADLTMSVCTGAFVLASTGLLSGKTATTHHSAYKQLALDYPDIQVKRGARFVENGNIATAGGLSSGIDLALRTVERYFGHDVAKETAYQMEYQGQGWLNPQANVEYAALRVSSDAHPLCPVCEMDVDPATALKSVFKGKTYYMCSRDHKAQFDASPAKFVAAK